jgi:hypothetical protein
VSLKRIANRAPQFTYQKMLLLTLAALEMIRSACPVTCVERQENGKIYSGCLGRDLPRSERMEMKRNQAELLSGSLWRRKISTD